MYLSPSRSSAGATVAGHIVREQPLASPITTDDQDLPQVGHLPMHLVVDGQGGWRLLAHMDRANPQWAHLQARPQSLPRLLRSGCFRTSIVTPRQLSNTALLQMNLGGVASP